MIAFKNKAVTKPMLFLAVLACIYLNCAHATTCITAGRMDTAGWAAIYRAISSCCAFQTKLQLRSLLELAG